MVYISIYSELQNFFIKITKIQESKKKKNVTESNCKGLSFLSQRECSLWGTEASWLGNAVTSLTPSTKVAFLCFPPSLHWFHELVPAESRWHALYTWMKHSLPSVLGAPLCCLHLLLLINAHILNILLSAHSQSGLPALQAANNPTGTEPLLG